MFNDKSRYVNTEEYTLKDSRGRVVNVVSVPDAPLVAIVGYHLLKQGQRPDHLAAQYLNDPAGFWKIAETNDVMLAETLSEQPEIAIPDKH